MSDRAELAGRLVYVAEDLDRQGYPYAGIIRQGARALLEAAPPASAPERRCVGCEEPLPPYGGRGRPRRWCAASPCQKARKNAAK